MGQPVSDVATWHGFAYMDGDTDGANDETRSLADWQIEGFVRWCQHRGYDTILLHRDNEQTSRFAKAAPSEDVRHRFVG